MIVFYKVIEVWCDYPFQTEIDYRYCVFSFSKKKFKEVKGLTMKSNTSIKEKEDFLKEKLNIKKINVVKL
jgi:hypothetical protein